MVLKLDPNNEKALLRRGQSYEQREKYKEAFIDYATAKKLGASVRFNTHALLETGGTLSRVPSPPVHTVRRAGNVGPLPWRTPHDTHSHTHTLTRPHAHTLTQSHARSHARTHLMQS